MSETALERLVKLAEDEDLSLEIGRYQSESEPGWWAQTSPMETHYRRTAEDACSDALAAHMSKTQPPEVEAGQVWENPNSGTQWTVRDCSEGRVTLDHFNGCDGQWIVRTVDYLRHWRLVGGYRVVARDMPKGFCPWCDKPLDGHWCCS